MKFKDYLNSLVSKRKNTSLSSKTHNRPINIKNHQESTASADCHYDMCGYEDINSIVPDDQHSRTQILLARHAELVNTIVETRSSHDSTFSSCSQCRISHLPSPMIPPPPPPPPPLPPKLSLEQQISFANRNYSSTLATCNPRRECHHHHHQQHHQQQQPYHQTHLISSHYSIPNPSVVSSSNSSLWATTASLSKKQRSRIRTNPWIGNNSSNNRPSTFIESSCVFHHRTSPPILPIVQPEYCIYDPTFRTASSGLIHSESFPQTISNGNIHPTNPPAPPPPVPAPTSNVILHQSDSGHGFSLASSRVIDSSSSSSSPSSSASSSPPLSSSSPNNTSGDGILLNNKQQYRQKKLKKKIPSTSPLLPMKRSPNNDINKEQYFCPNTISSDSGSLTRRIKPHQISPPVTIQYRYQRPSCVTKTSPIKSTIDRIHPKHHSRSSSSHSIDDHFSLEFEEILENERSYKQRKEKQPPAKLISPTSISSRKSPFILPLDETNIKLSSPPPILFSPTLTKTNSRAILKHIEEIENEIRLIKNLDLANDDNDDDDDDNDEYILSPRAYPEDDIDLVDENDDDDDDNNNNEDEEITDGRKSIYEQVDQWVEKCLKTTNNTNNSAARLHTECDHLSNTIKDYVVYVCSNDDQQTSLMPTLSTPEKIPQFMTAFYLSSMPTRMTKRTSSFIDEPLKLEQSQTVTHNLKSIHECPF